MLLMRSADLSHETDDRGQIDSDGLQWTEGHNWESHTRQVAPLICRRSSAADLATPEHVCFKSRNERSTLATLIRYARRAHMHAYLILCSRDETSVGAMKFVR